MTNVLQRFVWTGKPQELAVWWTLHRGSNKHRAAVCRMWSHEFGFELRLEVGGELVESQVCRTDDDILTRQETWRAGLEAKGWAK